MRDVYNFLAEKSLSKIKVLTAMEKDNEGFIGVIFPFLHPLIIPKGRYVYRSGTYGRAMYFVVRGECEVVRRKGIIQRSARRTYGVGDHFGQKCLTYHCRRCSI